MEQVVFLSNELLDPKLRKALRVPAVFISFGFIEGRMYYHFRNKGTFNIRGGRYWANDAVYGALYAIPDFDFYIRQIDSYHQCSKSLLGRNHINDIHIRRVVDFTPIKFNSVDELERLLYVEGESIKAYAYFGNSNHPRIKQRLNRNTVNYRIVDGVDPNLIKQIREVMNDE